MKHLVFVALALALALMLVFTQLAAAHARPKDCTPAINSSVTQAPKEIKCVHSEAPDLSKSKYAVYDAKNNRVDNNDAKLDPADKDGATVVLTLDTAKVTNGVYTVKWETVSKEDDEAAKGEWLFGVGVPVPVVLPQTGADTSGLFATLFAVGGVVLLGISLALRKFHRTTAS
jgi:LPXTG-motif cell wall-anchored protein